MGFQNSIDAFNEYQRIRLLEDKLKKDNRGMNLFNSEKVLESEKFYLKINKVSKINLIEEENKIIIQTNFPFSDWRYSYGDMDFDKFLKELKEWVSIPKFKFFIQYNRRRDNKTSSWDLPSFNNTFIKFEDLKIEIGVEARKEIKSLDFDFIGEVKKLLLSQRVATEEESKDFERFKFLKEEIENLDRQLSKRNSGYYSEQKDETIKISIDKEEYNLKLKKVEDEFKIICKKYSFFKMPSISYEEIKTELSLEDWKSDGNKDECEDEWSNFDDEDKEEYEGDFEKFLKSSYEYYLENNDFDE